MISRPQNVGKCAIARAVIGRLAQNFFPPVRHREEATTVQEKHLNATAKAENDFFPATKEKS